MLPLVTRDAHVSVYRHLCTWLRAQGCAAARASGSSARLIGLSLWDGAHGREWRTSRVPVCRGQAVAFDTNPSGPEHSRRAQTAICAPPLCPNINPGLNTHPGEGLRIVCVWGGGGAGGVGGGIEPPIPGPGSQPIGTILSATENSGVENGLIFFSLNAIVRHAMYFPDPLVAVISKIPFSTFSEIRGPITFVIGRGWAGGLRSMEPPLGGGASGSVATTPAPRNRKCAVPTLPGLPSALVLPHPALPLFLAAVPLGSAFLILRRLPLPGHLDHWIPSTTAAFKRAAPVVPGITHLAVNALCRQPQVCCLPRVPSAV